MHRGCRCAERVPLKTFMLWEPFGEIKGLVKVRAKVRLSGVIVERDMNEHR